MKIQLTVCFWNILFDAIKPSAVKPQAERLLEISNSLRFLPKGSIIGLAEIEGDNGMALARELGGFRLVKTRHRRANSHVGLLSAAAYETKPLAVDDHSFGLLVHCKEFTIVIVHLTFAIKGESLRFRQVQKILEELDPTRPAIIMGDFNSEWWQRSRKLLRSAGFVSTFNRGALRRTVTVPARHYRHMYLEPYKSLSRYGFSADDIYTRNIIVLEAGTFEGESDHHGVWARVEIDLSRSVR